MLPRLGRCVAVFEADFGFRCPSVSKPAATILFSRQHDRQFSDPELAPLDFESRCFRTEQPATQLPFYLSSHLEL